MLGLPVEAAGAEVLPVTIIPFSLPMPPSCCPRSREPGPFFFFSSDLVSSLESAFSDESVEESSVFFSSVSLESESPDFPSEVLVSDSAASWFEAAARASSIF